MHVCIIYDIDGLSRAWARAPMADRAKEVAEEQWARRLEERARWKCTDRSEVRGFTTVYQENVPIESLVTPASKQPVWVPIEVMDESGCEVPRDEWPDWMKHN